MSGGDEWRRREEEMSGGDEWRRRSEEDERRVRC